MDEFYDWQIPGTWVDIYDDIFMPAMIEEWPARLAEKATVPAGTRQKQPGPTGELPIPLTGKGAGLYGRLVVTGTTTLEGVLSLGFSNGYAPSQGDMFTFLTATKAITVTFDSVEISELIPEFENEITIKELSHVKVCM